MDWVKEYQLFLLDFDGLLVNTERLHYLAYVKMCKERDFNLDWSFAEFCEAAHYDSKMLRVKLYEALPELHLQEPNWSTLYSEKKLHYLTILKESEIELMPGAKEFLYELQKQNIKRVVVTHSPKEQVQFIKMQNKDLQTIEHWITREDYELSKPHPEPYLTAIERFANKGDKIIGFEDSPRGISSLLGTPAQAVLVNTNVVSKLEPLIKERKISYSPTLKDITSEKLAK